MGQRPIQWGYDVRASKPCETALLADSMQTYYFFTPRQAWTAQGEKCLGSGVDGTPAEPHAVPATHFQEYKLKTGRPLDEAAPPFLLHCCFLRLWGCCQALIMAKLSQTLILLCIDINGKLFQQQGSTGEN